MKFKIGISVAKLFKSNSKNFYSRNPINKFRSARYKNLVCSIKVFWGRKTERPNFPTSAPFVLPLKRGSLRDKPNANFLSPLHLRLLVASWALFIFGRKQSKKPDSVEEIESDCFRKKYKQNNTQSL